MKNWQEFDLTLKHKGFAALVSFLLFVSDSVLFCVFGPCLPGKIWKASECIPSRSASACCWPAKHTYRNTHTVTREFGISSTCLSPGSWDACQLHRLLGSQKTTGFVFDLTPTIHHWRSKKKKRDLSCQLLDKHKTSVDRKKKGKGETEIDIASVTAQR